MRATKEAVSLGGNARHLLHSPAAWEEIAIVMPMQRDVEHTAVLVKGLLGAVAMVNILCREMGSGLGKA